MESKVSSLNNSYMHIALEAIMAEEDAKIIQALNALAAGPLTPPTPRKCIECQSQNVNSDYICNDCGFDIKTFPMNDDQANYGGDRFD